MQERSATKRPYDSRGGVRDDPYYESKRPAMSDRYQYNVHLMCAATALNGHLLSNIGEMNVFQISENSGNFKILTKSKGKMAEILEKSGNFLRGKKWKHGKHVSHMCECRDALFVARYLEISLWPV